MEIARVVFPVISHRSPWFLVPYVVKKKKKTPCDKKDGSLGRRCHHCHLAGLWKNRTWKVLGRYPWHQRGLHPLLLCLLAHRILWSRSRPDNLAQSKKYERPSGEKKRRENISEKRTRKEGKKRIPFMKNVRYVCQEKQIILQRKCNT